MGGGRLSSHRRQTVEVASSVIYAANRQPSGEGGYKLNRLATVATTASTVWRRWLLKLQPSGDGGYELDRWYCIER